MLPGRQYARGWVSHQEKDIVVAPGEPFCTAKGSYFVLWLSVCLWADQTDVEGQTGKLAYMAEHTHQAARAYAWGKQQTFCSISPTTGHESA